MHNTRHGAGLVTVEQRRCYIYQKQTPRSDTSLPNVTSTEQLRIGERSSGKMMQRSAALAI
jgi:hypothetical protein